MLGDKLGKIRNDAHLVELLKGSVISFVMKMGGMILSYIGAYLINLKFGQEGFGYYSLINQLLWLIAAIATLGTTTSVLRYVGQFNSKGNDSGIRKLYGLTWKILLPSSLLFGALGFFTADYIASGIFRNDQYADAIRIISVILPLFVLDQVAVEYIRGLKKVQFSEFFRTASRPLILVVCLALAFSEDISPIYIIYFVCIGILFNFLFSNLYVLKKIWGKDRNEGESIQSGELLRVSFPMMMSSLSGVLMASSPLFILEYYMTTDKVGMFSTALKLAQLIPVGLLVVNTIAAPKFTELYWSDRRDELQKVIRQSTKMIFWSALLTALLLLIGTDFLLVKFKADPEESRIPAYILYLGQLVNASAGSVGLFLNMSGNQTILRNTGFFALATTLILAFLLIPPFGILGAAVSASTGMIIWNLLCILLVKRKFAIKTYYIPFFK